MKRGCLRAAAWRLVAGAMFVVTLAAGAYAAHAGPREKESPIVTVGGGTGVLLTNTIVATARHVVPTNGSKATILTSTGDMVQGTVSHYFTPSGTNDVPTGADFAAIKLDKAVSVYGDSEHYRMELFLRPTTNLVGNASIRFGSVGIDEWDRSGVPFWSFYDKVKIAEVSDSLVSVSGQQFTDLFNPFPSSDGSTHWWGYSGGPLVVFEQGQPKYIGANAAHYEYVNDPKTLPSWPNGMNGRRGVRYTDIATASGSSETKLDWLQSFIANNDPKGRAIATTIVGPSLLRDRIAIASGDAVSIGHTTTGPAASYDIAVERSDRMETVPCKSSAQAIDAGQYVGCTTRAIAVDDMSAPDRKIWNVVITRGGQIVRKIPITIGAALATADYYYMQGQTLTVRFNGAEAGKAGDRIALVNASGTLVGSAPTAGAKSGEVKIPLYDSTAAKQTLSGVVTVKWLRADATGAEQSIAETAIEIRSPVVRLFRRVLFSSVSKGVARPLDEILVDLGGGAPGWKLRMKRDSDTTPLWSSNVRTGYERVRVPRNANPGTGNYTIELCMPDGSSCPASTTLAIANPSLKFTGAGPLSASDKRIVWRFDFEAAGNKGVCDKFDVYDVSDTDNKNAVRSLALHRARFGGITDSYCYLNTVEGMFAGTLPMEPLSPGKYVGYMTDDTLGQSTRNLRHAALSFVVDSNNNLVTPTRYFEDGPVGSVEGNYRGEQPQEFGWAGKAEHARSLKSLIVRHGDILDGIELIYDNGGTVQYGNRRQGRGDRIDLAPGEEIVEVSGYHGMCFGARHILQITLRTNQNRSLGPYGSMAYSTDRTEFRFGAPKGAAIVDFVGASVPADYNVDRGLDRVISALGVIHRSP